MSKLPRYGSQNPKTVKTSSSKTTKIPGTNTAVTETTVTEIRICGSETDAGARGPSSIGRQSGLRAPGASSTRIGKPSGTQLRPPSSGTRPPQAPQQPGPSSSGLRTPRTGLSQSRGIPQTRPSTSQGTCGIGGAPCASGSSTSLPRPGGISRSTSQRGIPKPSGLQRPAGKPSGLQPPRSIRPPGTSTSQRFQQTAAAGGIEEQVHQTLMEKSTRKVGDKVTAKAGRVIPGEVEYLHTPAGREKIIKQTVLEKRVERDEEGERIVKNLSILNMDNRIGRGKRLEMGIQQLDPRFTRDEGKEVIEITSTVSVTPAYTTVSQECTRATTETVSETLNMAPTEVAKLVSDEIEDVENTLKMLPPDLDLSPGKYELKKRLQTLRLNSESVALLEQSIIQPEPCADEVQVEPTPEAMAAMMHTVEKGVPPKSTPDQVFNSLFTDTTNENFVKLSPITHGPLQDVVIPTDIAYEIHKEAVTNDMEKLTERLQSIPTAEEIPYVDIFTTVMDDSKKSPSKGKTLGKPFELITDEKSLWVNTDLEHLVNLVGADPVEVLDPVNIEELETSGNLEEQLASGIEYYVDVEPIAYVSRVQLRGSQPPSYFPGYMVALPEYPDVVKIAKSPDEVFASAWKSVQPKYFSDDSMQSVIF